MLNNIILQGRLTRSPEMKATASGISCATFTLACEQDYRNPNGERDTDFFDVVAWRGTADFVQRYFGKGQMAVVKGRLQTRQWRAEDGSKRKAVQIVAENVYFCGREGEVGQSPTSDSDCSPIAERSLRQGLPLTKAGNSGQATEEPAAVEESGFTPVETEDLPF